MGALAPTEGGGMKHPISVSSRCSRLTAWLRPISADVRPGDDAITFEGRAAASGITGMLFYAPFDLAGAKFLWYAISSLSSLSFRPF